MNTKYWNHFQKLLMSKHMSLSATSVVREEPPLSYTLHTCSTLECGSRLRPLQLFPLQNSYTLHIHILFPDLLLVNSDQLATTSNL